jgi:DNA-binding transcriptional LysR family regulator
MAWCVCPATLGAAPLPAPALVLDARHRPDRRWLRFRHGSAPPLLLVGTQRIALVHERLALSLSDQASLRLLEPPFALEPITQVAIWPSRRDADPAHRWLRERMVQPADELTESFAARHTSDAEPAELRLVGSASGR